ncbi:MAG TPA: Rieske (2Fe-2S) protein [Gammaproteobacteria bacterium]
MTESTVSRQAACRCRRRSLLKLIAVGFGLPRLAAADGDASTPPRENDRLVVAFGARAGQPIAPGDLEIGAKQLFAYPQDPVTGVVRNGSRLNQVIVVRLDPAELAPDTHARAVDGVVAYSGVCTHTGCDVTDWYDDVRRFRCPCHESEFDPKDGARVIGGPAPWPLAALPLKVVDGHLAVAGEFEGQVGFMQPGGLDPFGGI